MKANKRNGIVRWMLIALTFVLAALIFPDGSQLTDDPLQWIAMVALVALFATVGLPMTHGLSTFLPMVAMTAYLTLDLSVGMWALLVGLAIGGGIEFRDRLRERDPQLLWWVLLAGAMWPMAAHGLSIWLADAIYRGLGYAAPLVRVSEIDALLPVVAASVIYLLLHNLLLALDVWMAGKSVSGFFRENRLVLMAAQLLPMPLAPVNAVALASLGLSAYFISIATLLTVAIAVNRLVLTQDSLRKQVRQLSSYSSVNRALRSSLELDALLDNIYRQVAHMMDVDNFYIVLVDVDTNRLVYPYVSRDGRREERPSRERRDTFEEWVVDKQEALLVPTDVDMVAKRMELATPPEAGLQSWMGVPLQVPEKTIGCMAVYTVDHSKLSYDKEDLEILGNIASQASVAIENALLYENAKQHSDQLATLNEISAAINASLDPDQVLDLVSKSITRVAGCDKAAIYLLAEGDESLALSYSEGFSDGYQTLSETVTVPLTDAERDAVTQTGKVIAVPDIEIAENVSPGMVALAGNESFRSYANFPLSAHGHPIGLLSVYYDTIHHFQDAELELLQTFANQAALAVANARRYTVTDRALGRRVDQMIAISDVNQKLSATLDLDRVFHLVTDAAVDASDASAGMLLVTDEKNGTTRIGSWRGYPPEVMQRWQRSQEAAEGITGRVMNSGQTVLVDDVTRDPDFVNLSTGTRSQLSVPVMVEKKVIGVITLESKQESAFSDDDVEFVSQLAHQAGIAIKNAQLYKRLDEVNDRLHAILDSSSDGLLMIDTQGRIVMTNARMESFWDFARKDFEERTVDEFVADPLSVLGEGLGYAEGEINSLISQAARDPEMAESHDLYVTESGDSPQLFVERTASPVRDEFSNLIGLLMVFRDVTEQKELEEAREDLANMLVHDLRNPLTAVLASLALVRSVVGDKDETGIATQATQVSGRAVRKLLVMVNNLLDLSRLETGEFEAEQKPVSVSEIIKNAIGEMLPLAMEMEVTVMVEDDDSLDGFPDVNIDRDMIERVLLNLLDNALKFSPPSSTVRVRVMPYAARDDAEDSGKDGERPMLRLEVIDSGPGIPDDYKKRIFQRYEQVRGQKGRRRGTGLGLAFCRIAVDAHGGHIWVTDNPGGGSIFNLTLPVTNGAALTGDAKGSRSGDDVK